jgi:hypothetical protein
VSEPSGCDRARGRPRERRNAHAGECIHAHSTLSVEKTSVQVFYPFHPLRGATLQVVRRPKRGDGAVSVIDPTGRRLKIPVWMLLPDCAEIKITGRPHLSKGALLSLASLLSPPDPEGHVHDNLLQTVVDGCEGGQRVATTTSEDPNGRRRRAHGRNSTNRTDRSHGPRFDGGLSRGRRNS